MTDPTTANLDRFVPFLLEKVELARSKGIQQFTLTHANGEKMLVTLGPDDRVQVERQVGRVGGKTISRFPFTLVTTVAQLRRDAENGIGSKQAELYRG